MFKECLMISAALLGSTRNIHNNLATTSQPIYDENVDVEFVQGIYNFRDNIDVQSLFTFMWDNFESAYEVADIQIDNFPSTSGQMPIVGFVNPISYLDYTLYADNLYFEFDTDVLYLRIHYFYAQSISGYLDYEFDNNYNLSDMTTWTHNFMINFRNGFTLPPKINYLFNCLFTKENNQYLTSYNGYYTWHGSDHYSQPFTAFGSTLYSNNSYLTLCSYPYEGLNNSNTWDNVVLDYYEPDYEDYSTYGFIRYNFMSFPFNLQGMSKSMLVNWKMSLSSCQKLQGYGTFAYVRDTNYDNASFYDLLFSIMDSPFYMISRFLNWQLFGINLFVAFTGLLTLCVILVLIRHFW